MLVAAAGTTEAGAEPPPAAVEPAAKYTVEEPPRVAVELAEAAEAGMVLVGWWFHACY